MSRVAVVTAVAGRHEHLRAQRRGLARSMEPLTHVVVAMGDPSIWEVCVESPCVPTEYLRVPAAQELPLAAARNAGVACARRTGNGGLGNVCIHVRSAGGIRKGFVVIVCRACPDPPCARVCPTDALTPREGGGVRFKADLCIGCRNCVEACPFGAALWDESQHNPRICVYCGYCANYCPYGVIALEEL